MTRVLDRSRICRILGIGALVLVLGGCGGGQLMVQSNFSAPPVAAPVPPATGASPGLTVSTGRGLGTVIVLGLVIAEGIHWLSYHLRAAFGAPPKPEDGAAKPETARQPAR